MTNSSIQKGNMSNNPFDPSRVTSDPFLVIGWREGTKITCRKMAVDKALHPTLRAIAVNYLSLLSQGQKLDFEPNAAIDRSGEYFHLSANNVPHRKTKNGSKPASLLEELRSPNLLDDATDVEISEKTQIFYAFTFQQTSLDKWLTFVRKVNPTSFFKANQWWCTNRASLKEISTKPTFAFDSEFDLLIDNQDIFASSPTALKQLFTEVNLAAANVNYYVKDFVDALPATISLPQKSQDALLQLAHKKKSCVARIYGLAARLQEITSSGSFTADIFAKASFDDPQVKKLFSGNNIILNDHLEAEKFLDAVEGRFFEDQWTKDPRRADRFSSRR